MGYRSEIIAGVPIKDKKQALSIINDWDYTAECQMQQWDTQKKETYFYMKANAWKWYDQPIGDLLGYKNTFDGYEDVVAFQKIHRRR